MSLNAQQRRQTSDELRTNLDLAGLTVDDVAAETGLDPAEVQRAIDVSRACRPELVWLVRDHVEAAAKARGREPQSYTYLSEQMRAAASVWFPLDAARQASRPTT